jgi:hypothetical protein
LHRAAMSLAYGKYAFITLPTCKISGLRTSESEQSSG